MALTRRADWLRCANEPHRIGKDDVVAEETSYDFTCHPSVCVLRVAGRGRMLKIKINAKRGLSNEKTSEEKLRAK